MIGKLSTKIDLFGHSMGGAVALIVAFLMPGKVRRVYLLAPACMYKDNLPALFVRTLRKNASDRKMAKSHPDPVVRERMQGRTPGMLRYMSNPWRTIAEGIALGRNDIYNLLVPQLQKRGVEVFVLYAEHDELFPHTPEQPRLTGDNVVVIDDTTHDLQLYAEAVGEGLDKLHAAA